jgi:hypothetical protein
MILQVHNRMNTLLSKTTASPHAERAVVMRKKVIGQLHVECPGANTTTQVCLIQKRP